MSSTGTPKKHIQTPICTPDTGYYCRAKYGYDREGRKVLLSAEWMNFPNFGKHAEAEKKEGILWEDPEEITEPIEWSTEDNFRRSVNRAKVRAFDIVMSNPELNAFATMTIDPERCDRCSWDAIYPHLRTWLSNRVSRRGLKYILCPEYHQDGEAIHFHMICNADALQYAPARTPKGYTVYRKGKPVYNLSDWALGFSTMQLVPMDDPHEAVAKYIFKYMGKNAGAMIGGRHFLHGGNLRAPHYEYADELSALPGVDAAEVAFTTDFSPAGGMEYKKLYFK